jgi:hypothetical protein
VSVRGNIPDEVRRFIIAAVPSVSYLEALLLIRANPSLSWTPEFLAKRLYIGAALAEEIARQLESAGIIALADRELPAFRYAPQDPDLPELLALLDLTYRNALVEVSQLIHSKSGKRAQRFADAFKFRKD